MGFCIDNFSGKVAELKPADRTPENVLAVLRKSPMVSTWDMSEIAWIREIIEWLVRNGKLMADTETVGYPWIKYVVREPPPHD